MIRKSGVGIVDYGSGNVASLWQTLKKIGYRPKMLRDESDFDTAKVIVIPGVGAFPQAMERLTSTGMDICIKAANASGKRIIGICLGMQILADEGLEITTTKGLGLIPGVVRPHPEKLQVGWLQLEGAGAKATLFRGKHVYFNHNFYLDTEKSLVSYRCSTPLFKHPAIIRSNNIIGIQFHPEKSQQYGLDILGHAVRGEV